MAGPFDRKFCNSPFEYCYVDQTGDVFVCCPSAVPVVIGNLLERNWDEVWNSDSARLVRRTILDGSFAQCRAEHCPYLELGMRISPVDQVPDPYYRELQGSGETRVNRGPKEVNIAYDATCNLSCPYCRNEVFGAKGTAFEKARILHDKLWSGPLRDCEILTMAGNGDAFASRLYREALRTFDRALHPRMKIQIVTNGLLFTRENWESVAAAHPAIHWINISINAATHASFARNQRGGDFDVLLKNLAFVRELRRSGALPRLTFSFIVQTNNYREMPDFVRLGQEFAADKVNFTHLAPGPLGADEYRHEAIHRTNNPAHQDLLRVMAHPLISDPICYVANLSPLLPARRIAAGQGDRERRLAYPTRLKGRGNWLEWDDFRDALLLDETQAAAVRAILERLHDSTRRLLLLEPEGERIAPAAYMLDEAARPGSSAALDRFHAYLRETLCPETNTSYSVAISRTEMEARTDITRLLRADQAESLGRLLIENVTLVDIGRDAYSEAARQVQQQRGGGRAQWEPLAEACGLDAEQKFILGAILEDFKARWLQIAELEPEDGAPSPFQALLEALRAGQPSPHLVLVSALAETRHPQSKRPLRDHASDLEGRTLVKILAFLEPEQQARFSKLAPESLTSILLPEDPLEMALQQALAAPPAVRPTLATCGT